MFKKLLVSGPTLAILLTGVSALAAVNATHVLMNGGTNATVDKGDTVETRVTYTATASEDIESMSVEDVGSGIPAVCVDVPDQITTGTYHVILNDWPTVDGRNIDAPSFAGSWNRRVRLYGVDGSGADQQCTGAVRDTINSAGQLTVRQDPTPLIRPPRLPQHRLLRQRRPQLLCPRQRSRPGSAKRFRSSALPQFLRLAVEQQIFISRWICTLVRTDRMLSRCSPI